MQTTSDGRAETGQERVEDGGGARLSRVFLSFRQAALSGFRTRSAISGCGVLKYSSPLSCSPTMMMTTERGRRVGVHVRAGVSE